jgi:hypothetical protein
VVLGLDDPAREDDGVLEHRLDVACLDLVLAVLRPIVLVPVEVARLAGQGVDPLLRFRVRFELHRQ